MDIKTECIQLEEQIPDNDNELLKIRAAENCKLPILS